MPDGVTCIRSKFACLYRDEKSAYQVATSESAVVHRENTKRRPREIGTVAQNNCVHFSICACHPEKEIKRDKHKRKEDTYNFLIKRKANRKRENKTEVTEENERKQTNT